MCEVPFEEGTLIIDRNNPAQPGRFTGRVRSAGPITMVELTFLDGSTVWRPIGSLEAAPQQTASLLEQILSGRFGRARDLRRVITYEKLKGTLHEIIYSMEAAQIDFYPYQFKPVIKLIQSPTERLILADEVGLGKTIESALIWLELQARRQAKRLLVVCPNTLATKWQDELREKFLIDARVVQFHELKQEIGFLKQSGPSHAFALIGTYTQLRSPKRELKLLDEPVGEGREGTAKTEFLRELRHSDCGYEPFDLVVFDEAHYMRNPATSTFHLGEALSERAGSVVCVSATPINNSNRDLHSLLRLVDENFFESQGMFDELLQANRPAVQASNALSRVPVDEELLHKASKDMATSKFIQGTPGFDRFRLAIEKLDINNLSELANCQDMAEKLNLMGQYVNRTRRVQVKEMRPVRDPVKFTVNFSPEEQKLYQAIWHLVRKRCIRDNRPFHIFSVLGLQLRTASCLPAIAQEIRDGKFGDAVELVSEAIGDDVIEELFEETIHDSIRADELQKLLGYDFETNDSKYTVLIRTLTDYCPDEKVVIFAYYRPTLAYLFRRLQADGITVAMIHGGVSNEDRWKELDRFKSTRGPRVLLSSEVGSEGIDLQFSRVVVNYDLPWNPMRVEQRIGRIDRVGQQAAKLSIINFKVADTVEERLFDGLHWKLQQSANSLGDMEAVVGREVQQLTLDLLSKNLSPEQEKLRITRTEAAIEKQRLMLRQLEESGDALVALSDYLQRRIEECRGKGRFMQPDELEDYVVDFFEREFGGCEVNQNTPRDGCMRVNLTLEAHSSLAAYIQNDKSLAARPFRQREFQITFHREIMQRLSAKDRQYIHFTNHLSPLIRWITRINRDREHSLFKVSAISVTDAVLSPGTYCYRIDRWRMTALTSREQLAYAVASLQDEQVFDGSLSEDLVQRLLRDGRDWDRAQCDEERVRAAYIKLDEQLNARFDVAFSEFSDDNATAVQIRQQRVRGFFERRILQDEQRLQTLLSGDPIAKTRKAAEGRIRVAKENWEEKLMEIDGKSNVDFDQRPVAAGLFRII